MTEGQQRFGRFTVVERPKKNGAPGNVAYLVVGVDLEKGMYQLADREGHTQIYMPIDGHGFAAAQQTDLTGASPYPGFNRMIWVAQDKENRTGITVFQGRGGTPRYVK